MTQEDKQIIVDVLIFSSSAQVCVNFSDEKQARMLEIAKELGVDPSEDVEFWEDELESDEPWATDIPKNFKIRVVGTDTKEAQEEGGE